MKRLVFRTFFSARKTFRRKYNESFEWSTISSWLWIAKQDIELNGHRIWSHGTKAVIFALHSRSQTYELGIKPDRAVNFLSKVLTVEDESENAFKAAEDIIKLRTRKGIENVEKKIQNLDTKLDKSLLSERWKCELEGEKDALTERLAKLKDLEKKWKCFLPEESTAKKAQNCSRSCSYK